MMLDEVLAKAAGSSLLRYKHQPANAPGCTASLGRYQEAPRAGAKVMTGLYGKAAGLIQKILVTSLRGLACS